MKLSRLVQLAAVFGMLSTAGVGPVRALSFDEVNLVDLLRHSESIVVATVDALSDGIGANGLPYTEITLGIEESIRGTLAVSYTYRQYGLLAPRSIGNGRVMPAAPELFPRYEVGQRILLFLYTPAIASGLQTTVALDKGSFDLSASRAENRLANSGIFTDIGLSDGLANATDQRLLATPVGPVNAESMLSFVRRAVQERWVETKRMWKLSEGNPNPRPPTRPGTVFPTPGSPIKPQIENSGSAGVR